MSTPVGIRMERLSDTISISLKSLSVLCPVSADMNIISAYGINDNTDFISSDISFMVLSFLSSTASHLFTAIIIPFPFSWASPAILASCSVTPSVASIISTTISALSTAATVLITLYRSISSLTLLFLLKPAVSIKIYSFFSYLTTVSTASLVVPAISETISLLSPRSLFIRDDFPTLGLPTTAILGVSSSSSASPPAGSTAVTSSRRSPSPSLEDADTG